MGWFDKATEAIQKVTTIAVKFEDLERQVEAIAERQIKLAEKVARLVERLETVKMNEASEARSAAHAGVYKLQAEMIERVTRLETKQIAAGDRRLKKQSDE